MVYFYDSHEVERPATRSVARRGEKRTAAEWYRSDRVQFNYCSTDGWRRWCGGGTKNDARHHYYCVLLTWEEFCLLLRWCTCSGPRAPGAPVRDLF